MDASQKEFLNLIKCFEQNEVRYLIIGGFAVNRYGHRRTTGDVDFYIQDTVENRQHLIDALEQAGYGRFDTLLSAQIIAGYCEIMMDNGMYADLMTEVPGLQKGDFDSHYAMGLQDQIEGFPIRFIHYNHLLLNKKATGRPKDLLDVEELEKIHRHGTDTSC